MSDPLSSAPPSATVSTGDIQHIIAPGASSAAGDSSRPFRIPLAGRLTLSESAREEAALKLRLLERIHHAKNRQATAARLAAEMHGRPGYSQKRLINLHHLYISNDYDWRVVVNKSKAPEARGGLELSARRRHEFLDWAHGFLLLNQREKFLPRHRLLMERLQKWRLTGRKEFAIPGYDTPPENAPGQPHPAGWSAGHLQRLCSGSKFEKKAMSVGRSAAAMYRPMVLTTRRHAKVGQIFFFDDNEHDLKVRHISSQTRVMRPLEFACIDFFSGCFVANVFKPTLYDEVEDKKIKLRSLEFLWLSIHWLVEIGWRADTGTTLVAEHGTAKFPEWFQERVRELTRGLVKFEEGAVDRRASCEGFFKGPARGNFRTKSPLESMFNLVRNQTSDLALFPGQVGKDRDHSPEELTARESHEKQLGLAESILSREGVDLLRHDFLEWNQWQRLAHEAYFKINRRGGPGLEWWEHHLEGWIEAGLVANEWRLPLGSRRGDEAGGPPPYVGGYSDWLPQSALAKLNDNSPAIRELLHADAVNLTRVRKLSPFEVWERGNVELTRAPLSWLPLILPLEMGRPVRVQDDHVIEFQDQSIGPERLHFLARVRHEDGSETILRPGTECIGFVNQFAPRAIYLCDEKGRGLGEAPAWLRVARGDDAAVAEKNREIRRLEADLLKPVAKAAAEHLAARQENAAHNATVLQRLCPDGAPTGPRPSREEEDLAAFASAAFAKNETKREEQ